ncbi:hypothetical protein [Candidatus Halobonum tyrrellensis]|uniref:hypothetical protein n=1 Tax=Candidatus Halobonum tyrrellensis TaxID=1431545 RepID=UPI00126795F7|nr:hypothetical protein [Candidatus Halobonum tyrrellensis]
MPGSETVEKSAQCPDEHNPATSEQNQDEETCPNGEAWCEGTESDELSCFRCYLDGQEESR